MSQEILKVGISRLCLHKSLFTSFFYLLSKSKNQTNAFRTEQTLND